MSRDIELFIRDYLKELREENAAIFAGAGLSASAGFVNWKELLKPVAEALGLDIERESDLVAVAQYHCNENGGNRSKLNQLLIDTFSVNTSPTVNHQILARLPIATYWTTNYDQLIETSLRDSGKIADVKHTLEQLAITHPRRDAIVYKMHGDVEHADKAVLIKDDYERYNTDRGPYVSALAGDLVSKTFLFLGFSFTDPNLDYVLSRIRIAFQKNQRQHFCIFKQRIKQIGESDSDLEQAKIRQQLAIQDLKRFNIKVLLVDEYVQITEILARIERLYRQRTIFIAGSADAYGTWTKEATEAFLRDLCKALVQKGFRIATGFGKGIGDAVITGAIEQIFSTRTGHLEDSLIMRPFPRATSDPVARDRLWAEYRKDIISHAGVFLSVLGNKESACGIVNANGVRSEFQIAKDLGLDIVPVGASEFMSRELWEEVNANLDAFYPSASAELRIAFAELGEPTSNPAELISKTLAAIELIAKE